MQIQIYASKVSVSSGEQGQQTELEFLWNRCQRCHRKLFEALQNMKWVNISHLVMFYSISLTFQLYLSLPSDFSPLAGVHRLDFEMETNLRNHSCRRGAISTNFRSDIFSHSRVGIYFRIHATWGVRRPRIFHNVLYKHEWESYPDL